MNKIKLKEIYDNAKTAELSDIAAESIAFFAKKNERYLDNEDDDFEGLEDKHQVIDHFKESYLPAIEELRETHGTESAASINDKVNECYEKVLSSSLELAMDDNLTLSIEAVAKQSGVFVNVCEFVAATESEYNEKVNEITSIIGNTGDFLPAIEASGVDTFKVKYVYPYKKRVERLDGMESIGNYMNDAIQTESMQNASDVNEITIKDVNGMTITPMDEISSEDIIDYISNATTKSLYSQMKKVHEKYGAESVEFEHATDVYKNVARTGVEATVMSMCVCGALGIPYNVDKIKYNALYSE